jgi:hypothetical protein
MSRVKYQKAGDDAKQALFMPIDLNRDRWPLTIPQIF